MKAITALFVACVTCSAFAGSPPAQTRQDVAITFESLDRNHDQQLSQAETTRKDSLRRRFRGVDANGDGYLSRAEFTARPSAQRFE